MVDRVVASIVLSKKLFARFWMMLYPLQERYEVKCDYVGQVRRRGDKVFVGGWEGNVLVVDHQVIAKLSRELFVGEGGAEKMLELAQDNEQLDLYARDLFAAFLVSLPPLWHLSDLVVVEEPFTSDRIGVLFGFNRRV